MYETNAKKGHKQNVVEFEFGMHEIELIHPRKWRVGAEQHTPLDAVLSLDKLPFQRIFEAVRFLIGTSIDWFYRAL